MSGSPSSTPVGGIAAAISNDVVRILHSQTGRGPAHAKTVINGDLVVCLLHDTLTVGERTLVESGQSQAVLNVRQLYQRAMRAELSGAVEARIGRRVVAFMSDNHIDPDTAVEVFLLESRGASQDE